MHFLLFCKSKCSKQCSTTVPYLYFCSVHISTLLVNEKLVQKSVFEQQRPQMTKPRLKHPCGGRKGGNFPPSKGHPLTRKEINCVTYLFARDLFIFIRDPPKKWVCSAVVGWPELPLEVRLTHMSFTKVVAHHMRNKNDF